MHYQVSLQSHAAIVGLVTFEDAHRWVAFEMPPPRPSAPELRELGVGLAPLRGPRRDVRGDCRHEPNHGLVALGCLSARLHDVGLLSNAVEKINGRP